MNEIDVDVAVLGSTPLARLVAGLLAQQHGRSVVLVGESQAGFRLPRGIDLSVAPLTRPESWAMLGSCVPETVKLLGRIGAKRGMARIDPIFFAESPLGRQALSYVRHTATGFGQAVERLNKGALGPDRESIVIRDAVHLQRARLEPMLDAWLDGLKVRRHVPSEVAVTITADGSATLSGETVTRCAMAVLLDDIAIAAHLAPELRAGLFDAQAQSIILTEPTLALAAPVMLEVDSGLYLSQSATRGIVAMAPGEMEHLAARLGVLLSAHRHLHRAGQSHHLALLARDRAPLIGRAGTSGPVILAGFGPIGAFLAPAMARQLAGAASETEAAFFAAHAPSRTMAPSSVADYAPALSAKDAA